jgi:hypothetical protein
MELRDYRKVLEFEVEHHLTEEPLRIDCIVVKKTKDVEIKKNIAAIFREYNLFEYKNPGDYVSIADFYKVYAYACLYISSLKKVPINSLTLSFVERRYPRKLLSHLQKVRGYTVEESAEGIYTIKGDVIPIQIIDSRRLSADENLWLNSLSNRLNTLEIARISEEITRQKKGARIASYLNAIAKANHETLQEAIEMSNMSKIEQVFENVGWTVKWEARGEARGRVTGEARGMKKGEAKGQTEKALEIAHKMKAIGRPSAEISEVTGLSPETVQEL